MSAHSRLTDGSPLSRAPAEQGREGNREQGGEQGNNPSPKSPEPSRLSTGPCGRPMTPDEIARLATSVHGLRPEWETASLRTLLAKHAHKPLNVVAAAAIWIASDATTNTPGRLNEPGPWWHATEPKPDAQPSSYTAPWTPTSRMYERRQPCGRTHCVCTHTAPCDSGFIEVSPAGPQGHATSRRCPNCTPARTG